MRHMLWLIFILCSYYLSSSPGEALSSVSVRKQNNIWTSELSTWHFQEKMSPDNQSERRLTNMLVQVGATTQQASDLHLFRAQLKTAAVMFSTVRTALCVGPDVALFSLMVTYVIRPPRQHVLFNTLFPPCNMAGLLVVSHEVHQLMD